MWHSECKCNACFVVVMSKVKYRAIKKEGDYLTCCSIDLGSASDKFDFIMIRNNFIFKVAQVPVSLFGKMTQRFEGLQVVNRVLLVVNLCRQVTVLQRELLLRLSR